MLLAEVGRLEKPGEIQNGTPQGFGRNGTLMQAGTSQQTHAIYQHHLLARFGPLNCPLLAGGARADHHQVRC